MPSLEPSKAQSAKPPVNPEPLALHSSKKDNKLQSNGAIGRTQRAAGRTDSDFAGGSRWRKHEPWPRLKPSCQSAEIRI